MSNTMFNANNLEKAMKQMGMDTDQINAKEVIIKQKGKKLVFEDPEVTKVKVQGREMFQLQGDYSQEDLVSEEDAELVAEKGGVPLEEAKEALKEEEDMTDAIMSLKE